MITTWLLPYQNSPSFSLAALEPTFPGWEYLLFIAASTALERLALRLSIRSPTNTGFRLVREFTDLSTHYLSPGRSTLTAVTSDTSFQRLLGAISVP